MEMLCWGEVHFHFTQSYVLLVKIMHMIGFRLKGLHCVLENLTHVNGQSHTPQILFFAPLSGFVCLFVWVTVHMPSCTCDEQRKVTSLPPLGSPRHQVCGKYPCPLSHFLAVFSSFKREIIGESGMVFFTPLP